MVSILPAERTPWDVIGKAIGQNVSQNLPGAVQQGYQRQLGMNALQQAEQDIANAGNDPYKIALAFAKVGAQNPALERSLGPLMQTAMANAQVNNAFPKNPNQQPGQPSPIGNETVNAAQNALAMGQGQEPSQLVDNQQASIQMPQSQFVAPTPFNIMTPTEMEAEAQRYASALRDPNAYQARYAQLQNQNNEATKQRESLEDFALKAGIPPADLPMFMRIGSKFNPKNPSEWAINAKREYSKVKNDFDKLQRAFIPGIGSGLLGRNREQELSRMTPTVQDLVKKGLEQETRTFLADNYLSPTEIELQIHPLQPKHQKALSSVPKGFFPAQKEVTYEKGVPQQTNVGGTISYEEALEKAPKELQLMQNNLANFFMKNVDANTPLLGLREKLVKDKDYDWRQIGPAIRQAEQNGLQLTPSQSAELTDIETQPPLDSLPEIFRSLDRPTSYIRGNK